MSGDVRPPDWERESVSLSEGLTDDLSSIYTTASCEGRATAETQAEAEFTLLGKGTGRVVVTGSRFPDGTVAKVAINQRGCQANLNEKSYREEMTSIAPYLPPVLQTHSENHWNVYEECTSPPKDELAVLGALESVLDSKGVNYEWRELASQNVGTHKGGPCIVNWAELF